MYKNSCAELAGAGCSSPDRDLNEIIPQKSTRETEPSETDYSDYDIVKATQFGALNRVKELVELGFDINKPDGETVTLLHWASINNRKEVVQYLLQNGAIVDALGGDLSATPLHWATRQGHLNTVVVLLSAGADATIRDNEGCSCIHLAAQFGHTALIAYFIAKGVHPDIPDRGGMTALMWAAWKVTSLDPVRLLLTLGANPSLLDHTNGNTALHWAILARNSVAIYTLVVRVSKR